MSNDIKLFYDLTAPKTADEWYKEEMLKPTLEEFVHLFTYKPRILDFGCASLIHIAAKEMPSILKNMKKIVKTDGCITIIIKDGEGFLDAELIQYGWKNYIFKV